MAIVIDNKTQAADDTATFSHTTGTLTNGILIVLFFERSANDTVSGVTYNGVALTRANFASGNNLAADIWYLLNPAAGAHNVVINTTSGTFNAIAVTFSSAAQISPVDQVVDGTGTGANPSVNITPTKDNELIIGAISSEDDVVASGAGETNIFNIDSGTWGMSASYVVQTTKGTQAVNWTASSSDWAAALASFLYATTIALTGTATESINEADIVAGGKTIILTITNDTWVASGATFDAQRQNIINGLDSAQAEGTGWDAEVKAKIPVTDVVRTSDTVVTITLSAEAGYNITAQETITATIPATALTGGVAVVASPTFTVDPVGGGEVTPATGFMTTNTKFWG